MSTYVLTADAEIDLKEIAAYTLKNWGLEIFEQYRKGLKAKFTAIANNSIVTKSFSKTIPDVFVTKYRYHFIFYIEHNAKKVIIAVIHEQRDLVNQLVHRLI